MDCPNCGRYNEEDDRCGTCGSNLKGLANSSTEQQKFTLADFLIENTNLFTILGVIGALSLFFQAISTSGERSFVVVTPENFVNNFSQIIEAQSTSDTSLYQYGIFSCYAIILLILAILLYRAIAVSSETLHNFHPSLNRWDSFLFMVRILTLWIFVMSPVYIVATVVIIHSLIDEDGLHFFTEIIALLLGLILISIFTYAIVSLLHFLLKSRFSKLKAIKYLEQYDFAAFTTLLLWLLVLGVTMYHMPTDGYKFSLPLFIEIAFYAILGLLPPVAILGVVCIGIKIRSWLKRRTFGRAS